MPSPFTARLRALAGSDRIAIEDGSGSASFNELVLRAHGARSKLSDGKQSLEGRRVILFAAPGVAWVEAFLGIALGGGVAVPLSAQYPPAELAWFAEDAAADTLVVSPDLRERAALMAKGRRVIEIAELVATPGRLDEEEAVEDAAIALLLYTSGTTGRPKGAMIGHDNLAVQAALLREAWGFSERDVLLHALPLHHLHGFGISLMTSLLAGATTRMLPRFDAERVWDELGRATVWMAVPTMYQKLVDAFDAANEETRARWARGARGLRLATSGSAALPVKLADRWRAIAGEVPLERFGMTEIGVGMSNPLDPPARRPGSVGLPLPTVDAKIVDDHGNATERGPGELWIRGPSVFRTYLGREEATREAFDGDWFKTGDVAEREDDGYFRLLGRTSVDILKSGGYKLSALEIEEALRENPAIAEVAVVGIPDATWGDRVVAVVVPVTGRAGECAEATLRAWAKERIAAYKVPRGVVLMDALPRNAIGKVLKPEIVKRLTSSD